MLAFAGNSLLCRLALAGGQIDAASFTAIRAVSGAVLLMLIAQFSGQGRASARLDWLASAMLFTYMVTFSFAYIWLSAGTGALILFGAVQLTMIGFALRSGETLSLWSWLGFLLAFLGLVWLVLPGLAAPNPAGAGLMMLAGIAWGAYTLLGRRAADPLASTSRNFLGCGTLALITAIILAGQARLSTTGVGLALTSGAITSGLGYVVWYAVLPRLSAAKAASVQLTVPIIAALLGMLLLDEALNLRLTVASIAILGGVGLVVAQRAAHTD
jgi:drug/metabolite transporter (DMT)-like permease